MSYTTLTPEDGEYYLPKVWNIAFISLTDENHFPEFWHDQLLRECSLFEDAGSGKMKLFVCGEQSSIKDLLGDKMKAEVFLFGAYNQVNVCQMRARGVISRVSSTAESERVRGLLRSQVRCRRKADGNW